MQEAGITEIKTKQSIPELKKKVTNNKKEIKIKHE